MERAIFLRALQDDEAGSPAQQNTQEPRRRGAGDEAAGLMMSAWVLPSSSRRRRRAVSPLKRQLGLSVQRLNWSKHLTRRKSVSRRAPRRRCGCALDRGLQCKPPPRPRVVSSRFLAAERSVTIW